MSPCPGAAASRGALQNPLDERPHSKAERTGFEPVDQLLTGHVFSKDAHSTTLPPLRNGTE